jgi:hypothetical protein
LFKKKNNTLEDVPHPPPPFQFPRSASFFNNSVRRIGIPGNYMDPLRDYNQRLAGSFPGGSSQKSEDSAKERIDVYPVLQTFNGASSNYSIGTF